MGALMYLFTVVATLALAFGLPVLLVAGIGNRRARWTAALVAAGFAAGGLAGWSLRPFAWEMPLWETARAAVNAEQYGHAIESQAERVLLYFLFTGDVGAVAAGIGAILLARRSRRE